MGAIDVQSRLADLDTSHPLGLGYGLDDGFGNIIDMDDDTLAHTEVGSIAVAHNRRLTILGINNANDAADSRGTNVKTDIVRCRVFTHTGSIMLILAIRQV